MNPVKSDFAAKAHLGSMADYEAMAHRALTDSAGFWMEQAERLSWFQPPRSAGRWDFEAVDLSWFDGGLLNASYNCVDRHIEERGDKTAILWAMDEPGEYRHITYRELQREVGRVANVLRAHGVAKGDRVCLYLPMIPELAYAMLACARIGAVHSIVFAGFSAEALRDRILDAGCRIVLTSDEGLRGGRRIPLKQMTDAALEGVDVVETVLVAKRTGAEVPMVTGRDLWLDDELAKQRSTCPPEWMAAEDPLFILYTSGSTGKPKGLLHTTGGYMVYAATTHELVFDLEEDDLYCCAADIGWITGHSYIVYGPLANGATTVMFESTPLYPDAGRYWRMVEELGITILYTAPTALRALMVAGDEPLERYDRSSLRLLGTVGEPINPEAWRWYYERVGQGRCPIVDTWWQTETGGVLITPLPGAMPLKPGCATLPLPGIEPVLVDEEGAVIEGNDVAGNLCMARSWPGQARTIWGDHARFKETYFSQYPGLYFTGDGCRRDEDGFYWITGRVDDVINISGHRLGTAEVESALVAHEHVAEAAVVGFPHEIKGTGIYCFVIPHKGVEQMPPEEVVATLRQQVRTVIGPIATPDHIQVTPGLPKTRSGKIMRRILRKIAAGESEGFGDTSTLAEPGIVDTLVAASKRADRT